MNNELVEQLLLALRRERDEEEAKADPMVWNDYHHGKANAFEIAMVMVRQCQQAEEAGITVKDGRYVSQ